MLNTSLQTQFATGVSGCCPSSSMDASPTLKNIECAGDGSKPSNDAEDSLLKPENLEQLSQNNREKSPMCLVNELARFNDVQHQYQLIEESGPPHQKTFTVLLKLAETEEYRASGPSIRKAQHSAATIALQDTKLPHPTPKTLRKSPLRSGWPLTPTVELNVLAMKRGEPAIYKVYEPRGVPLGAYASCGLYDFRGMYNQRYHYPRGPYCATVTVNNRHFTGKGKTAQCAKHAAAEEALKVLRAEQLPVVAENVEKRTATEDDEDDAKSPISIVHEMALKYELTVKFDVVSESGPSHMPTFITRCIVGSMVTEGEGNGKKTSKRKAAEKMLEEMNKLTVTTGEKVDGTKVLKKKPFMKKKRLPKTNINGEQGDEPKSIPLNGVVQKLCSATTSDIKPAVIPASTTKNESSEENLPLHPINRLIHFQQARKEREPQFRVISEREIDSKRKEFILECVITSSRGFNVEGIHGNILTSTGVGMNKKIAKRKAAEELLKLLGYSKCNLAESNLPSSSNQGLKEASETQDKFKKLSNITDDMQKISLTKNNRQLAPGLFLMPQNDVSVTVDAPQAPIAEPPETSIVVDASSVDDVMTRIAIEFDQSGQSATASKSLQREINFSTSAFQRLQIIVETVKGSVEMHISDIPTPGKSEFLSVITLTTSPPRVCHGLGRDVNSSRDAAALEILNALKSHTKT